MTGRVWLAVVTLHVVVAMVLLPAKGAVVLDGSAQACDAPLHARVVQVGASQVLQAAVMVEVAPPAFGVALVAWPVERVPVPEVDAIVRVRGPPSA